MAVFKCKSCSGTLQVEAGQSIAECEYCGVRQTLPKTTDDEIKALFDRAAHQRVQCEFDKAESTYEKILERDGELAEAHWGIILCKFGIEYVEDPATGKRLPTCHRTSYESIVADESYKLALQYADEEARALYEEEAQRIDEIQKGILDISRKEEPYDVFICYKETGEDGNRTVDSTIANDIYFKLTEAGYRTFYAPITLEDKLGKEYEPLIFAALSSARVMLCIGTRAAHFNAVWVKNEWSRFLKMMKTNRDKLLIPCYRDMDVYDLPEEFAHLQAQNMGKIGFVEDLLRGIGKVIPKKKEKKESASAQGSVPEKVAPLLRRASLFLEDEDWENAESYAEQVLDVAPECAEAYVICFLASVNLYSLSAFYENAEEKADKIAAAPYAEIKNLKKHERQYAMFPVDKNLSKARRFGDDEVLDQINAFITAVEERVQLLRERIAVLEEEEAKRQEEERQRQEEEERKRQEEERKRQAELAEQERLRQEEERKRQAELAEQERLRQEENRKRQAELAEQERLRLEEERKRLEEERKRKEEEKEANYNAAKAEILAEHLAVKRGNFWSFIIGVILLGLFTFLTVRFAVPFLNELAEKATQRSYIWVVVDFVAFAIGVTLVLCGLGDSPKSFWRVLITGRLFPRFFPAIFVALYAFLCDSMMKRTMPFAFWVLSLAIVAVLVVFVDFNCFKAEFPRKKAVQKDERLQEKLHELVKKFGNRAEAFANSAKLAKRTSRGCMYRGIISVPICTFYVLFSIQTNFWVFERGWLNYLLWFGVPVAIFVLIGIIVNVLDS